MTTSTAYMGDAFWDNQQRLWTFLMLDREGNQIGDAQYDPHKTGIETIAQDECKAAGVYSYTLTNTKGVCFPKRVA